MVQELFIGHRIDDDVETDTEIYNNAIRTARSDCESAEYEASARDFRTLIANADNNIIDRVANPEKYDRDGKKIQKRKRSRPASH